MKLYLVNSEDIYFPQIKNYFREIISSYDNGNYRSAIVMLYSTIVCDLLLKLKELSEVYSDEKAEKMLAYIEKQRKMANKSAWEWELIEKIYKETELLNDESYTMLQHIYDLRNFSAHPALTDEYELISPTSEMTVAYIKKALTDILVKPSVFAQNIIDRMSDDISSKKEIYSNDMDAFRNYLHKAYFERMSEKMMQQVFRAFWKFVFIKVEGDIFDENRLINRKALEFMLEDNGDMLCKFVNENSNYFKVTQEAKCLNHLCILLGYYPKLYRQLDEDVRYQIDSFNEEDCSLIKWFVIGDLEQHITMLKSNVDVFKKSKLDILRKICQMQGVPRLFNRFIIRHYSLSNSYASAKNRFDFVIARYMKSFSPTDFIELIDAINRNDQIYNYGWQTERNDKILAIALPKLPTGFDLGQYENFEYTKPQEAEKEDAENSTVGADEQEGSEAELPSEDDELSF